MGGAILFMAYTRGVGFIRESTCARFIPLQASLPDLRLSPGGKIVTVENVSGRPRGRVVGTENTSASHFVEELGKDGDLTGQKYELDPDGNSFHFFHDLLKTKK